MASYLCLGNTNKKLPVIYAQSIQTNRCQLFMLRQCKQTMARYLCSVNTNKQWPVIYAQPIQTKQWPVI
jgi:hypothetical protein